MYPETYKYTTDHEWIDLGSGRMGITDYAQKQLGDIVFLELPEVGKTVKKGEQLGTVESVKAVSEVFAPGLRHGRRGEQGARREARGHQPGRARQLDRRAQAGRRRRRPGAARRHAVRRVDQVTHRYIPNTDEDARRMLEAIGVSSVDALFEQVPAGCGCSATSTSRRRCPSPT